MPRFVILEHDHPFPHWDFMLEAGGVLRTWRLHAPPAPGVAVRAEALGDHRLHYLDYEGPVSGNRGSVQRWDVGTFAWGEETPARLVVALQGARCQGQAVLQADAQGWSLLLGE